MYNFDLRGIFVLALIGLAALGVGAIVMLFGLVWFVMFHVQIV